MPLPLDPSQCVVNLLSTLRCAKANMIWVQCHHKMATNSKWNKETNPNAISQKLSTIQCVFLFKLFLWKCRIFTILVVLKGSRLKRLRYGIHNHLRYKMIFLHVPLHVPWEMSRIVDLQFKVRPCWLGHVGTQKPKKDKSFRKSPYNLWSPNICSIFVQHQVPHCHRSQDDFIMSLKIISDIFVDSQSAMPLPLDPSQCIVNLLSTLRCAKANMIWVQCHHKMATNSKWNKETNPNGISQKLSTIQCVFLFKLFLWKCRIFTILVVLKGSRLKRLRYGIHNYLRYKMNFLHVPLHVPREMSRIVDLQFKVRPCWLGHVGTQKPKKDKSFRKSPYNLLSPNICSIFISSCHWKLLATSF